jgi:pimeloyl-ACP methyl ester carboxylesterase
MNAFTITEHVATSGRHTTAYLACGAEDRPVIVFVHGWPELSISWRHQLPCFAALGFRAIAPDLRGYGGSSVYRDHGSYAVEHVVTDMLELLDALGQDRAVWVGHDWGSPVVWSLASHHPERCHGVANLCVPYQRDGFTVEALLPLVDRSVYPASEFPAGQWDYQLFYLENFDKARRTFEANVTNTVKALFRGGDPRRKGQPARTARVRKGRRLVRWRRARARRAARHGRAVRGGARPLRERAPAQRLLRPGLVLHEPGCERALRPPGPPQRRDRSPRPLPARGVRLHV